MSKPILSPMQLRTLRESIARINIAWGPVRAGKTVGLELYRWLHYVRKGPPGDLLMAGKTMKALERNVLRPALDTFGAGVVEYSLGKKEARIAGRRIELEGANDAQAENKIRGMTLAGALCNEITLMPESFFKQVLARMSVRGAKLFGTTNTDSPYHWLKTDFLDREGELDLRQWRFELSDNIFLGSDYVRGLKAEYTGLWHQRFIEGLWVQAAGAVYDMWDEDVHVAPCEEEAPQRVVGVDYGTSNPCTFHDIAVWPKRKPGEKPPKAHVLRERYHDGRREGQKTDAEHADDLADFTEEMPRRSPIYIDPSAASFIAECRSRGLPVKEADNSVLDGIRYVASMLSSEAVPTGAPHLQVQPQCEELRGEFSSYVWDERAQERGEDKPAKRNDHGLDGTRYALFSHLAGRQQGLRTASAAL
jgi:PBSX family phage terminase large subunit